MRNSNRKVYSTISLCRILILFVLYQIWLLQCFFFFFFFSSFETLKRKRLKLKFMLRLDCCILDGIKHWMEKENNENELMLCVKNSFPTSALHPHLKPHVVYLDPHTEDASGNCFDYSLHKYRV